MNEMKEIAEFLYKRNLRVHVDTKDGGFYNGLILQLSENFLVVEDRVLGECPIAFSEIKVIERFREEK